MNRRTLLTSAVAVLAGQRLPFPDLINRAEAQGTGPTWRHGLAKFGELKYPTGFKQFDNVNAVVAGVKGTLAQGIDQMYDTLLVQSLDEVSSAYGLLAESVSFPQD